ncbi:hypothetical protein FGL98_06555 [Leekyejoonella antrihumi]|uniref:Uncharacterized protein n=1 Tax=Leekyejoonella antrihumi TaxID=1660198 RepID=A0A563E596_9MICO|nr:hypothetical protein FGL98_06555 [Leekyejoonella antrihumi]
MAETLLSTLAKSAGNKIGGALAGWALDSIFGSSATPTDELKAQLDGLQNQMTDLQTQVHSLDAKLDDSLKKLMTQADRNTYDEVAAQANTDAAELADYQIQLDSWLKRAPGTAVDGSQSSELQTMRSTLGVIIQHINLAMTGATGSRGLIAIYRNVIQDQTPYPTDRFYTSDFTTPMSDMLDYYESLTVQAFNMLAEVNHLSWTTGGTPFAANDAVVQTYANLVPTQLAHWSQLATGGVGRLPEGVVADTTTGLMWSRSRLTLAGSAYFCWTQCNWSASVLPAPATVIDGLTGWTIPSYAQFAALTPGLGDKAFAFLRANGFQWQQESVTPKDAYGQHPAIVAPAYWTSGDTMIGFLGGSLHLYDQSYLLYPLWQWFPGPGVVAVRAIH